MLQNFCLVFCIVFHVALKCDVANEHRWVFFVLPIILYKYRNKFSIDYISNKKWCICDCMDTASVRYNVRSNIWNLCNFIAPCITTQSIFSFYQIESDIHTLNTIILRSNYAVIHYSFAIAYVQFMFTHC